MIRLKKHIVFFFTSLIFLLLFMLQCRMSFGPPLRPQNIIIMISDGCGFNHVDAACYYKFGARGRQVYEKFPVRYAVSTYPVNGHGYDPDSAWASESYLRQKVTDSAASATAISTGIKTQNGVLGLDAEGHPAGHILERLERLGKASGVVSSVPFSHATPAGFVVHQKRRGDTPQIISEMISESPVDVIMGAGHPEYDRNANKLSDDEIREQLGGIAPLWAAFREENAGGDADGDSIPDPWVFIETREAFRKLATGPAPKRVFGLAPVGKTLQQNRAGDRQASPFVVPKTETVPTLSEMSKAAINVLDDDPDGFFLMIEGGAVDWASHQGLSGRMIEEQMDFNATVQSVVEWIETESSWKETLLIITADHETGFLTGPADTARTEPVQMTPIINNGKGKLPAMVWNSGSHTNSLVPLYVKGAGSRRFHHYADEADPVRGKYIDNTEIAKVLFDLFE